MKIGDASFLGIAPKLNPALLPQGAGQVADRVLLVSGALTPRNLPALVSANIVAGAQSVYPLGPSGGQIYLSFATDTDVAPSPLSDGEYRCYYSDGVALKKTSLALASGGGAPPNAWYYAGVPAPLAAPTLASTTGSVPSGTWAYVFTNVAQFGTDLLEESQPSAAGTITLGATGGVTVTFPANPSTTNRNYVYKRVYRTTGSAYQMVAQVPFANATFTDNLAAASIPADALLTSAWAAPKDDLKGLCALPGGVLAAFRDNEIWFSEPNYPHAWPAKYKQTVPDKIVGIKAYGSTLVVATVGRPHVGTGLHPDSYTFRPLPLFEPCVSKRSMAAGGSGVYYASANGVVMVGDQGYGLVSADQFSRLTFAVYRPSELLGAVYNDQYYGFNTVGGFSIPVVGQNPGVSTISFLATAAAVDPYTARLLTVQASNSWLYDFDPTVAAPGPLTYKSKLFHLPAPLSMGVVRVSGNPLDFTAAADAAALAATNAGILAENAAVITAGFVGGMFGENELDAMELNGDALDNLVSSIPAAVSFTLFQNGLPVYSASLNPNQIYRLPATGLANTYEYQVTSFRTLYAVEIATAAVELSGGVNG